MKTTKYLCPLMDAQYFLTSELILFAHDVMICVCFTCFIFAFLLRFFLLDLFDSFLFLCLEFVSFISMSPLRALIMSHV